MAMVEFKSTPENYRKEKTGVKRNTVRKEADDERFKILRVYMEHANNLHITIRNSMTGDSFTRTVTDVTFYEGMYIISWMTEEKD